MNAKSRLQFDDMPYTIRRNGRRRALALSLAPDGGIRVLAPAKLSLRDINKFLQRHAQLVREKIERLRSSGALKTKEKYKDGSSVPYQGQACLLRVTQTRTLPNLCAQSESVITINIPDQTLSETALSEEVGLELRLWYKKQAKREFETRLKHWATQLGVSYRRAIVTSPERRWGSCSARNEIRLNWRLILAPPPLIDYVVAHELCHILHKNHAKPFWQSLGKIMPNYAARRRALRAWEKAPRHLPFTDLIPFRPK